MKAQVRPFAALAALVLVAGWSDASRAGEPGKGEQLFAHRCGMCHRTIGMGVSLLSRRPGDTSGGLLEQRKDLSGALVKAVVRAGIGNMPRIARAEVSDPELALIADYLAKGNP